MAQPAAESLEMAEASPIAADVRPADKTGEVGFRVVQNATALFAGRGVGLLFAAGANAILARYLGVEKLGEYGAIYAYLGLFAWLATLGLQPVVTREASERPGLSGTVIATGVWLTGAGAIATLALALALAPLAQVAGKTLPIVFLAGLEILVIPILMVPGLMYQVNLQQWYPAAYGVARQVLWLFAIIGLYLAGASLFWIVAGRLAVAAVDGGLNWNGGTRRARGAWKFEGVLARRMLRHSLPISVSAFAGWIYLRIDQVMLHRMVNDYALGQYVAAVRISELTETLPSAIVFAIFPVLCAAAASQERFINYLSTAFRTLILAGAVLCLAIFASSNFIVKTYYGARFAEAAPLLNVLIWSEIAVFFGAVVNTALLAKAREKLILIPTISGAAINIALNLWAIPRWGAMGACWATLVSYAISSSLLLLFSKAGRELLNPGWRVLAPTIMAILVSVAVMKLAPINGLGKALLSLAVFSALATVLRLLTAGDLERIRSLYVQLRNRQGALPAAGGLTQ